MRLNNMQVADYIGKLSDALTKKQADTIETVASLLDSSQQANLGKVLAAVFPGKDNKEALNSLRVLRNQIKEAAKACSIEFEFSVDTEKRKYPDQRNCWFEGTDLSSEKMEFMQTELLRNNPEYRLNDYTPPMARSKYPVFVSSSDNRGADAPTDEERSVIEDFLRRLRISLKGLNRYDLAEGLYHFREQQENLMFKRIENAMSECEVGLLLFSKPYMASKYVKEKELPRFNPVKYRAGEDGSKDSIPILLSPCFDNDPAKINEILGLAEEGGLQILRYQDKRSFTECREQEKESFIDIIANRLNNKIPEQTAPTFPTLRRDHLNTFTIRQRDKLNDDCGYSPTEWEPTRGECPFMGRAATALKQKPEPVEELPKGFDALERLIAWAIDPESAHVHALLGDLGSGKTFTCRMLALQLLKKRMDGDNSIPLPIYIDLREVGFTSEWQGAPTLDNILEGWLKHWQLGINPEETHGLDVAAIKRLSQAGALWIFDGFDEISAHLPRNSDTAFFRELLRPVAPQGGKSIAAKVLISCRSHYFPTLAKQNATLLEETRGILRPGITRSDNDENPELICDSTLLLPFDESQIKSYLGRTLGEAEAGRAMEVIASIHDLTELSRQPYLLRLIRGQIGQLEIMKSQGKPVNAASLYGLFVADWLQRDEGKHTVEPEDKLRLMERLAAQMWSDRQRGWTYEQLQRWALAEMEKEPDWRFRYQAHADLIAKDLHTAAFIVRYGESSFRFIHTSMQEYFVAAHLLRGLREQCLQQWDIAKVTVETLAFLADLWQIRPVHEHTALFQAQRQLHATPPSPNAALLALDYLLIAHQKRWPHVLPDRLDLSGTDICQRTFSGEPNQLWHISLLRLEDVNAPQLQMSYLNIKRLDAHNARLVGSRWQHCTVEAASLRQADLGGIQLRYCNWQKVLLDQTNMRHAELRLSRFDLQSEMTSPELNGPAWWLSSNPAPPWATKPPKSSPNLPLCFAKIGHNGAVNAMAWRSDGQQLASVGGDGMVRIWDAASGACLLTLTLDQGVIISVAWRSDGQQLASVGMDGTIRLWDAASGACLLTLAGGQGPIRSVAWRSDGQQLASAGRDGTIRIWDATCGTCLLIFTGDLGWINSVAWRSDGLQLASAGDDGTVRIWDTISGACIHTLTADQGWINSVAWRSDGQQLASAGEDGTVRIWDVATGGCLLALEGDQCWLNSVAWRGDGQQIASTGEDGSVQIWDASSGACLQTLTAENRWIISMAWRGDGQQLALAEDNGSIRIWDATKESYQLILTGDQRWINSIAWCSDGQRLASGGGDGTVRIWDATSGTCKLTLVGNQRWINSVAWCSDGKQLASAGRDGTIQIWDVTNGVCQQTFTVAQHRCNSMIWCKDGKLLASAVMDGIVRIWDATNEICQLTLAEDQGWINSVAWRSDCKQLATAHEDGKVRIWDVVNGTCLKSLAGNYGSISTVAWRDDGQQLASAGNDGTIRIWDSTSGDCVLTLAGAHHRIKSVTWRKDGQQLASAGMDGMIRIWDVASGICLLTLKADQRWVKSVAWRSDGQQLASAGMDGTVRIWDTASGKLLYRCIAIGEAEVLLNEGDEVIRANDAAWPYLARLGNNPETGERMWIPAEVDEIVVPQI